MNIIKTIRQSFQKISTEKIQIFVRHCHFSEVSQYKQRIEGFSRQACFENFMETVDRTKADVTFLLDTHYPMSERHFVLNQTEFPVIEMKEGTETGSFLRLLEEVNARSYSPDTIIYFLEDDYLHRPNWTTILSEGFTLPMADYVTLYDHQDKYFLPMYQDLQTRLFRTKSCHWRMTPSTTNTYAMRFKTLKRDLQIHREFSLNRKITADHEKFCKLKELQRTLISCLPGWSTHVESAYLSPCFDWTSLLKFTSSEKR